MNKTCKRIVCLLLVGLMLMTLLPSMAVFEAVAADLSSYLYQLPSKTLNDAGTKYRQNMSYVIITRKSKVVVIDGGYETNNSDANYLISFLKEKTGKSVPHIDAWIFTHAHEDHIGAFKSIAKNFPEKVTVDKIYYNFPTPEQIDKYCPESSRASTKNTIKSFEDLIPNIKKPNGQPAETVRVLGRHRNKCLGSFDLDVLNIEILMTCEDVFEAADKNTKKYSGTLETNGKVYSDQTIKQLVNDDFGNNVSMVFRVTVGGKNILFLGDAAEPEGIVLRDYHDTKSDYSLKSDIVQMAHHGQNAVPKTVYEAIAPSICLFPAPDWLYDASQTSSYTTWYTRQWVNELKATSYASAQGLHMEEFPDIRQSAPVDVPADMKPLIFDATYYANLYSDLKDKFGTDEAALYSHFLNYGIEEGRCGSPYFDLRYYMSQNSQKLLMYCRGNYLIAFQHFVKCAYDESEFASLGKKLSPIFDCKYYKKQYSDVAAMKTEIEALTHFVNIGQKEGRIAAQEVVNIAGVYHTPINKTSVAATCTTDGYTAGRACSTCGKTISGRTVIPAMGHTYVNNVCTTCGFDRGYVLMHFQNGAPELGYSYQMSQGALAENAFANGNTYGSMEGYILNGSDAYVKMLTGNLNYELREKDIVQIRVMLTNKGDAGLEQHAGVSTGTLVFNKNFKAFLQTSANPTYSGTYCTEAKPATNLKDGEYGIVTLQPLAVNYGNTLQMIRIDFLDGYGASAVGKFSIDYIYVGPMELSPVSVQILDLDGKELYSCYHGYGTCVSGAFTAKPKESDAQNHYVFDGWQDANGNIIDLTTYKFTADMVLTPHFAAQMHNFTVSQGSTLVCEDCDYSRTCSHEWNNGEITTVPTCTEEGVKTYTCLVCRASKTEKLMTAGHTEVTDEALAPTCTATGLTEGKHCSVCNEILVAQEVIAASGHNYKAVVTDPTCTENGYTTYTCAVCQDTYDSDYAEANGHDYQSVVTHPTCTENGYTTYTCSVCADTYIADEIIASGHSYDEGKVTKEPTCTEEGIKTFSCACGDSYTETIEKRKHETTYYPDKQATCTEDGHGAYYHCKICSGSFFDENCEYPVDINFIKTPASGHAAVYIPEQAATCTEDGYSAYYLCTSCNGTFFDEACEYPLDINFIKTPALGHTEVIDKAVAPTCTETGLTEGKHCSVCNEVLVAQTEVAALGHSHTYTDNGENHTVGCANCDYSELSDHTFVDGSCICGAVEKTEPKMEYVPTLEATMSISVGAEMQVFYTLRSSVLANYTDFYVEVVKNVAGGEPITTIFSVENGNLEPFTNASGKITRYSATYTGIAAKEMGDSFTSTVYAVDAEGNKYYGPSETTSIKEYLTTQIESDSASAQLKTLAVDMLHYGAAAQINFAYDAENLVNADLTEEQNALGTQEDPTAANGFAQSASGCRVNTSVSIGSKVELYLTFIYKPTAESKMELRIKNAKGDVIDTLTPAYTVGANYRAVYDNVGAKQMRELITIELYDNDTLVSKSTTWSVETYVAQTIENSASAPELVNVCKAMLTYGDAAAAYLASSGQ